jgi:dehydrogenase/reductase SDR family member 12
MLNYILDKSIYFSFDQSGFKRHQKYFKNIDMSKTLGTVLITGGTSGIGESCSNFLLSNGNKTIVTGRNSEKFSHKENLSSVQLDMVNWDQIIDFVDKLDIIDHLVLNAGGMPSEYAENDYQVEYQTSSQLLGHLILFRLLEKKKKLRKGGKVILVSSGGMLLKKLDLETLFQNPKYDKVDQYANVKRAQVIMNNIYADRYPDFHFSAMHPGWVGTNAVKDALPGFYKFTVNRLRNDAEGADTINWLLLTNDRPSGRFWFDRKEAKTDPMGFTNSSQEEIEKLDSIIEDHISNILKKI